MNVTNQSLLTLIRTIYVSVPWLGITMNSVWWPRKYNKNQSGDWFYNWKKKKIKIKWLRQCCWCLCSFSKDFLGLLNCLHLSFKCLGFSLFAGITAWFEWVPSRLKNSCCLSCITLLLDYAMWLLLIGQLLFWVNNYYYHKKRRVMIIFCEYKVSILITETN